MKICLLASAASIHTVRWANSLSGIGHKVYLITMHKPKGDQLNSNIKVYNLPISSSIGYYLNLPFLKILLRVINPDILHAHYASGYGTLSRLVKFKMSILSVWGSDVYLFPNQSKRNKKILIKNFKSANYITSTSKNMKKEIEKYYTPNHEIFLTPFGINTDLFKSIDNDTSKIAITIGTVKSLEEVYGLDLLIKAFSLVKKRLEEENLDELSKKIRLLIVGEGSQKEKLIELCYKEGIIELTTFIGKVPNNKVPYYLNQMDIFCTPSLSESFGVSYLEASSCELPVIGTNVGGVPEVIINNKTGYIIKPKSVSELATRIYDLVKDGEKRKYFGKNGREFVINKYSWKKCVSNLNSIYKTILH